MILFASGLWFEIDLKDNVLSFEWLVYYPCLSQQVRKFANNPDTAGQRLRIIMYALTIYIPKEPWNKNKIVGQKLPLKLQQIWSIRIRL
jgi:hypothetical protein